MPNSRKHLSSNITLRWGERGRSPKYSYLNHICGYPRKANLQIFKLKEYCHKVLSWDKAKIILLSNFGRLVAWIN